MRDTAVIMNELGEVSVDHHLLRRVDERTVVLDSGCVCCSLRGDLADELRDLLDRRARGELPSFTRVVVETTGLADPAPIVNTVLNDPMLHHHVRLDAIVATIDGVHARSESEHEHEWVRQTVAADRLCITKTDLAPPDELEEVERRLKQLNPLASVHRTSNGEIDAELLLAPVNHDPGGLPEKKHVHGDITAFTLFFDEPLDWIVFGIWLTMLLQARGRDMLRVKGLLNVGAGGPVLLNGVRHVFHPPVHLDSWPDDDRRSRIVFIGRGLDCTQVERSLAAFQARHA